MTVKELIISKEILAQKTRLEQLEKMNAPAVIISSITNLIAELENGDIKIGGATEKLDNEVTEYTVKTGRGGKQYIEFTDGTKYFPNAKYGRYII